MEQTLEKYLERFDERLEQSLIERFDEVLAKITSRTTAQIESRTGGAADSIQSRVRLIAVLGGLTLQDFRSIVDAIPGAAAQVPEEGHVPTLASKLIRWAESVRGPALPVVWEAVDQSFPGLLGTAQPE